MTDKTKAEQLDYTEARAFYDSEAWQSLSYRKRAEFQLSQELLCMPFEVFHEAVEKTLGRPVFTPEFGLNADGLRAELFAARAAPGPDELLALIPEEKRVLVIAIYEHKE